jgi:Flp pilus assembly protein TadD
MSKRSKHKRRARSFSSSLGGKVVGRLFWLIPLLAILVYLNTFGAKFTYDDVDIVEKNETIRTLSRAPELFSSTYWAGVDSATDRSLYRPVTMITYAVQHSIHGLRSELYHVVNVALHVLASILLFLLIREIFRDNAIALVSGLLFAVHAVHTEAVASVVGRAEILAFMGILGCTLSYFKAMRQSGNRAAIWSAVSILAYLAGMMSKEGGIMAPAVIITTEVLVVQHRNLLKGRRHAGLMFAGYALCVALFLFLRSEATSGRVIHTGFADVRGIERIYTGFRVGMEYTALIFAPVRLNADYWLVPIARSPFEPTVLAGILLTVSLLFVVAWSQRKYPVLAWGLCFWGITLLPVSNIPFAIGVMKAERLIYSPSAGLLVAAVSLLAVLSTKGRVLHRVVPAIIVAAVVALSVLTWQRNYDWGDNYALARATLRANPNSPSFNMVMGNWNRSEGDNAEARKYYLKALDAMPLHKSGLFNLGNIALDEGEYDQAILYYRQVLNAEPDYANAINNLGRAYHLMGRYAEAADMYERFRKLRPDTPYPYINLSAVYIALKDYDRALAVIEEALSLFPDVADLQVNAAVLYRALGREEDAQEAERRARDLD